jgi:hypothetical protein
MTLDSSVRRVTVYELDSDSLKGQKFFFLSTPTSPGSNPFSVLYIPVYRLVEIYLHILYMPSRFLCKGNLSSWP